MDKDAFWAELAALGEDQVRENIGLGLYREKREKSALEWLRQIDKAEPKPKTPLHETTLGILLIMIIGGLAVAGAIHLLGWNEGSTPRQELQQ